MAGYCSICGSLKIQETCLLCGSLNNNSTLEDGSGSGAGDASVQNYSLHRFIGVPIPPPAFHTTPHPNVSPPSPSPAKGGSCTPIGLCISTVLPAASPPGTGLFSNARGELPKPSSSPDHEVDELNYLNFIFCFYVFLSCLVAEKIEEKG